MLRLGILLPRSTMLPSLGLDILNGLKSCLDHYKLNQSLTLVTGNIGFGTDEADVYAKTEKLLLEENADIIIVVADEHTRSMLGPLFTASNKLLIMVNPGANLPGSWNASPNTLNHSLNFCLHARLTGQLAAEQTNKHVAYTASYYDAGYLQCYSMLTAHQQAGGIPDHTYVTHFKSANFTLAPLDDFLKEHEEVKTLLCLFAADLAELFYREIGPVQEKYDLKLYTAPMMLDESLTESVSQPLNIKKSSGFVPWYRKLDNEYNRIFSSAFQKMAGKEPNYFAVLGWDTGLLLQQLIEKFNAGARGNSLLLSWNGSTLQSPRGWLKLDMATHRTYGPSWLVNCTNNIQLDPVPGTKDIDEEWKQFISEKIPEGLSSGWRNTYLCI